MKKVKCLVTGVAGFIGSHLAERLVGLGYEVVGIDCFTDYYSREIKERNVAELKKNSLFFFHQDNLLDIDLQAILASVDYVFHQAAQAGVRASWGRDFEIYIKNNILVTQRLLEAAKSASLKKIVYASSSSVYGDTKDIPMKESSQLKPVSPYGVTKLAAENLCYLYWKSYGVPVTSLRYFTVYGPRQRPDMAFHKFIKALLKGKEIEIYGDGGQTRDFTYISDAVNANILAMENSRNGEVYNIGGGSRIGLSKTIDILERATGVKAKRSYLDKQRGDMRHTYADISKARQELGFHPQDNLESGLAKEAEWLKILEG